MFAPWIAHVFTDVVIAGIVVFLARPNQSMKLTAGSFAINFWDDYDAFSAGHALSVSLGGRYPICKTKGFSWQLRRSQ